MHVTHEPGLIRRDLPASTAAISCGSTAFRGCASTAMGTSRRRSRVPFPIGRRFQGHGGDLCLNRECNQQMPAGLFLLIRNMQAESG